MILCDIHGGQVEHYRRLPVFDPDGCLAGHPILVWDTASGSCLLRPRPLLPPYPLVTFTPCCACCSYITSACGISNNIHKAF